VTKPARRSLRFESLDDVLRDAEGLLATGYTKTGSWSLGQVCGHLAAWFRYQMDGYPPTPLLLRPMFWVARNIVAKWMMKKMFAHGQMKPGMATIPQSVMPADADDAAGVAELRDAVARWKAYTGPLQPSPLFGHCTREQWFKGHLIHCAHHLSFLVPK